MYETTFPRAALALLVGIAAGTVLVTAAFILSDIEYFRQWGLKTGTIPIIVVYSAVLLSFGLLLVAPLPWFICHRAGQRGPVAAVVLGVVLTFIVALGLLTYGFGLLGSSGFSAADSGGATWKDGVLTAHGWVESAKASGVVALFGPPIALVVWRVAYRRTA